MVADQKREGEQAAGLNLRGVGGQAGEQRPQAVVSPPSVSSRSATSSVVACSQVSSIAVSSALRSANASRNRPG
jgi:mRNA-degrading endonuclease toxin of MazEF toxin-antitoxin module